MTNRLPMPWHEASKEDSMSTSDVLHAVSRALRGDRQGARSLIGALRDGIESRVQDGLASAGRREGGVGTPIRGARLPEAQALLPIAPPAKVTMRLPDGRKIRIVQVPAAARHRDMLNIARVNDVNTKRAFAAITHNGRAIDRLACSQDLLADRITKLQADGDLYLLRGMVEGLAALESRVRNVERAQQRGLAGQARATRKESAGLNRALESQARALQVQKFHDAVGSMQSVALATGDDLLTRENVLLAGNQLGWSFATELLRSALGSTSSAAALLAWAAPLASLATSKAIIPKAKAVVPGFI